VVLFRRWFTQAKPTKGSPLFELNRVTMNSSDVRELKMEGARFWYVPGNPCLAMIERHLTGLDPSASGHVFDGFSRAFGDGDVRLAFFPVWWSRPPSPFFLFWRDGSDLAALDRKVLAGEAEDADFEPSVATVYQKTACIKNCGLLWPTLVMRAAEYYVDAPALYDRKLAASKTRPCPACGYFMAQAVVKIFSGGPMGRWPLPLQKTSA